MDRWWLRKIQNFCRRWFLFFFYQTEHSKKKKKLDPWTGPMQMCDRLKTKTLKSHAGFDCYSGGHGHCDWIFRWCVMNGSDWVSVVKAQFGASSFQKTDIATKERTHYY